MKKTVLLLSVVAIDTEATEGEEVRTCEQPRVFNSTMELIEAIGQGAIEEDDDGTYWEGIFYHAASQWDRKRNSATLQLIRSKGNCGRCRRTIKRTKTLEGDTIAAQSVPMRIGMNCWPIFAG